MRSNSKQIVRNSGLDLLRAIAIAFVLVYHLPFGDMVQGLGLFGVEIFLTLSGYLVATMIFERFGGVATTADLKRFLLNRWLRTLPLYYLVLGVTVVSTAWFGTQRLPDLGPFLTFAQNLTHGGQAAHGSWFGASWSLALEEWFYVLLPLTLWFARHRSPARIIVALTIVLVTLSVGGRALRYATATDFDLDDMYRRVVLFRLDTFCWGMLMYCAVQRWQTAVVQWRHALFIAGFALIAASAAAGTHPRYGNAFMAVAFFTTASIGTALLIPFFSAVAINTTRIRAAVYVLSTRTYALYLTHGLVYLFVAQALPSYHPLTWLVMLAASLAVADAVYRYIEHPILNLRDPRALPTLAARIRAVANGLTARIPSLDLALERAVLVPVHVIERRATRTNAHPYPNDRRMARG